MQAAEARKRAGFAVKEKEQPAWMRKPSSSVPARPAPQHSELLTALTHSSRLSLACPDMAIPFQLHSFAGHVPWRLGQNTK